MVKKCVFCLSCPSKFATSKRWCPVKGMGFGRGILIRFPDFDYKKQSAWHL